MKALTALTMGKKSASVSRMTPIPAPEPQSDVLFEMFQGVLGSVHLGRLLRGHDAGRLVTLRRLRGPASVDLAAAADLARSIAHPKLAKVLGLIEEPSATYLVSEHISGVTLFELGRAASNRQLPVLPNVAVRIILDALTAADAAEQLLDETLSARAVRTVYPECIWIADFGETFVSEVLIAPLLARTGKGPETPLSEAEAGAADVRAAALELVRMACAGLSAEDPLNTDLSNLPDELQEVLIRALGHGALVGYANPAEFIQALSRLDESLIATEDQVGQELRRLMGTVLTVRRQKLDMLERSSVPNHSQDQGDETKFFRLATKTEQRVTARPPPDGAKAAPTPTPAPAAPASTRTPTPAAPMYGSTPSTRPEPMDEPTLLFKRNESGGTQANWVGAPPPAGAAGPASQSALDQTNVETFVRERLERNEITQMSRARESAAAALAPATGKRAGSLVWAALAVIVGLTGVRMAWLVQRDHSSPAAVLHGDTEALRRTLAKLLH